MTTMVVDELQLVPIEQPFSWTREDRSRIFSVRPYLYVQNFPAGTFTLSLLTIADVLLAEQSFTAADVYASIGTLDNFAAVNFPVIFENKIHVEIGEYKIRLISTGYIFNETSFIGWIREHEDLKVDATFTPAYDTENPLTFEIWVAK